MQAPQSKKRLRREIEEKRSALPPEERSRISRIICERVAERLRESASSYPPVVFSYLSFGAEVDTFPLLEFCWRAGIPTAAPRTLSKTKEMKLHLLSSREDVQQGIWGIPEPKPECPELPDTALIGWVLMPGLAFDPKGGRLGYGGGYYDRFLSEYARRHGTLPFLLALAFELQLVPEVPTEPHDIPVHAVVTESRWVAAGEEPFLPGRDEG
ncbi:5-formyltetrahydrofolate cyclo-ligase [Paenibacillus aurantius]|uniref:5-formyltetrahydrofolate cyclo-ligase n=1 Tax=Paenibacillus aurantius TaxID=2918900 RepID=A0AA96LF23_9BACL|nr:5-formyltetrahydrofolate cyclo-ligase [Paenibacillus aurantius]WNQ10442.1 5-formyltetrahydrofolate cyclo-ligase [Paenibacillus aurantius]